MASELVSSVINNLWNSKSVLDYVHDWPLMKSPVPILTIWILYLIFVLKVGPDYMKNRPAYRFTVFLVFYNTCQVIYSIYMLWQGLLILRPMNYLGLKCDEDHEVQRQVAIFLYINLLAKISELSDTILFVLRKKQNQVTFLHVYHHSIMVLSIWSLLKFEPSSYSTIFVGTINAFVHVIMYAYYALSAFPSLTKYLWWKKYITALQVSQFVFVILHSGVNYIYSPSCKPSYILLSTLLANELIFIYLFGKFYIDSYIRRRKQA